MFGVSEYSPDQPMRQHWLCHTDTQHPGLEMEVLTPQVQWWEPGEGQSHPWKPTPSPPAEPGTMESDCREIKEAVDIGTSLLVQRLRLYAGGMELRSTCPRAQPKKEKKKSLWIWKYFSVLIFFYSYHRVWPLHISFLYFSSSISFFLI